MVGLEGSRKVMSILLCNSDSGFMVPGGLKATSPYEVGFVAHEVG